MRAGAGAEKKGRAGINSPFPASVVPLFAQMDKGRRHVGACVWAWGRVELGMRSLAPLLLPSSDAPRRRALIHIR
jgi:hypothetical protein